jgi:hypothetical protein
LLILNGLTAIKKEVTGQVTGERLAEGLLATRTFGPRDAGVYCGGGRSGPCGRDGLDALNQGTGDREQVTGSDQPQTNPRPTPDRQIPMRVPQLKQFQILPQDAKPLSNWKDKNKYWRAVAEGIQAAIRTLQKEHLNRPFSFGFVRGSRSARGI